MGMTDSLREGIFSFRFSNQVDMITHQTPCQDGEIVLIGVASKQGDIEIVILRSEKNILKMVSSMCDMVWALRDDYSCDSCHREKLQDYMMEFKKLK